MSTDVAVSALPVETDKAVEVVEQKQATNAAKAFLSGGFGGISAVLVGQPFDLIKVRLQTTEGVYKGAFDCFRKTIAKDGVYGLYRGMSTPLAAVTPVFAVSFWSYDLGKKICYSVTPNRENQQLSLAEITFAGAFSALPTTLLMAPSERIKVLLQIQGQGGEQKYKGPLDVVRQLYKEGGIRSIFRGTGATLLRDGPGSGAYFLAYELTKRALTPPGGSASDLNVGSVLVAGGMAGVAMWSIAIPPDVLKSKLQSAPAGTYTGIMDVLRKTLATEGPQALFKGLGPALARAVPANAACFLGVEVSLKAMNMLW